jgi:CheY-like chemotaxis protein
MWKPELIICDVEMPVLSGPEMALQVFLKDAGGERIPILPISGVAELHLVAQKWAHRISWANHSRWRSCWPSWPWRQHTTAIWGGANSHASL